MNKTAVVTTLLIVIVILGGIWVYDSYFRTEENTAWDLVPETAALVYEPQNGDEVFKLISGSEIWQSLLEVESFEAIPGTYASLDSVAGIARLDPVVKDGGLLITLNPISGSEFDFLYIIEKKRMPELIAEIVEHYRSEEGIQVETRLYNTFTIFEVKQGDESFIFAENDDFWWGSTTSFLVEDVIRQLSEEGLNTFKGANPEVFFHSKIKQDAGNIYFNYPQLSRLLASFLDPSSRSISSTVSSVGKSAFVDFDVKENSILLTGFSYYPNDGFLKSFENKLSSTSNLELYIPNETAFFKNYFSESFPRIQQAGLQDMVKTLSGEVGVSVLESNSIEESEKLVFIRSDDPSGTEDLLTQHASKMAEENGDSLYYEDYSGYRIVEISEFDTSNFIDVTENGNQFFVMIDNLLVVSNSIQTLKKFLVSIENEDTWGKSIKKSGFLESTLEESNYSLYVDVNKSWNYMVAALHPSWQSFLEEYEAVFRNFDLLAIQYSYTDSKFFTSIVLTHDSENSSILSRRPRLDPDISLELSDIITTKPKVVRNHNGPGLEVITQTQDGLLHLIAPEREVLWGDSLPSLIHGEIQQIDYFNNGKLQYAFATDSMIHVVDRNGNDVEGFPVRLDFVVDKFNVIDYDRSKNYRFILSDVHGNVYLRDKAGRALEGWNPKPLNGRLANAPYHIRVRGRDCIIAFQERGRLNIMNRRGEFLPGFPMEMGPDLQPGHSLEIGGSFSTTLFSLITTDGQLTTLNLNGEKVSTRQLFRPSRNMTFSIVPERQEKGFIIIGKDIGLIQFMDSKGNELFREDIMSPVPFNYQYYDFGSNRKLYIVTDPEQEYSYLFDKSGNMINNSPIDSKFEISVLFSEINKTYKIYSAYENKVNVYSF